MGKKNVKVAAAVVPWPLTRVEVQKMMEVVKGGGVIEKKIVVKILEEGAKVVGGQPTVVDIELSEKKSVNVVGDTHGQIQDVWLIFERVGLPTRDRRFVFNGDYVDRGTQGCEVVIIVLAWLLCDPGSVVMLRGNHEDRMITGMYGFSDEVRKKYDAPTYELFMKFFATLPLAAVVQKKVLILHGGLFRSQSDSTTLSPLSDLRALSRTTDTCPDLGIMTDVLWSDPTPTPDLEDNPRRGSGCLYPDPYTTSWLDQEELLYLVRSHEGPDLQPLPEGYALRADDRLITVFSATNYGGHGNKGCVAVFTKELYPRFISYP